MATDMNPYGGSKAVVSVPDDMVERYEAAGFTKVAKATREPAPKRAAKKSAEK